MQISASNLLIAAQQPRAPAQQLHSRFAQVLSAAKGQPTSFKPASFEPQSGTPAAAPEAGSSAPSPTAQAKPYTAAQAPGARLDIRI